jgi:hypothetical protein
MLERDGIAGPRGLGPWTIERWDDRGVDEVGELGERHRGWHLDVGAQIAPVAADDEVVARRQQGVEQLGPRLAARIAVAHHRRRGREVVGRRSAATGIGVETHQTHHPVRHPALGRERRQGDGSGAEPGSPGPAGETLGQQHRHLLGRH